MAEAVHNPDQFMFDLRQILAQGRKRIGLLLGAGCPADIRIDPETGEMADGGNSLIPAVSGLTEFVINQLDKEHRNIVDELKQDFSDTPNVEDLLSRARSLGQVLGTATFGQRTGSDYHEVAEAICTHIGERVSVDLPHGPTPYSELVSWIGGIPRSHAIEIFTPNYDLLIEEAFERARLPYFDGFTGAYEPFFDPSSIANNDLPARWPRVWKLHGSLGWQLSDKGQIIRKGDKTATQLIYPEHLKYERTQKLPYTALFERLRSFLLTPDTLLLTCGFSFFDAHISAVIEETLSANPSCSVFAMQYRTLNDENAAMELATRCPNLSVYASDGAVINCVPAPWRPAESHKKDWEPIRSTYWHVPKGNSEPQFSLGSFSHFARFFGRAKTSQVMLDEDAHSYPEDTVNTDGS